MRISIDCINAEWEYKNRSPALGSENDRTYAAIEIPATFLHVRGFPGEIEFDSVLEVREIAGALALALTQYDQEQSRRDAGS